MKVFFLTSLLLLCLDISCFSQQEVTIPTNSPLRKITFLLGEYSVRGGGIFTGSVTGSGSNYIKWRLAQKSQEPVFGLISWDSTRNSFKSSFYPSSDRATYYGTIVDGNLQLTASTERSTQDTLALIFSPGTDGKTLEVTREQINKSVNPKEKIYAFCFRDLGIGDQKQLTQNALTKFSKILTKPLSPYSFSEQKYNSDSTELEFSFQRNKLNTDVTVTYDYEKGLYKLEALTDEANGFEMIVYKGYLNTTGGTFYSTVKNNNGEWRQISFDVNQSGVVTVKEIR